MMKQGARGGYVCPNPGNVHSHIGKSLEQPVLGGDVPAYNGGVGAR